MRKERMRQRVRIQRGDEAMCEETIDEKRGIGKQLGKQIRIIVPHCISNGEIECVPSVGLQQLT
jgi:hypothetical protein